MSSKRYKGLPEKTKELKSETIDILLPKIKKNCTTKFDESVDIHFQINLKQKKGDINLRTVTNLPSGTGKKIKVAVICEDDKKDEAEKAGADLIGSENLINNISSGKIDFEKLVSTPSMMIKLAKVGKILGPKGLMPNPKLGTVTKNVGDAVKALKSGQIEIKNDKDGNLGASIGKKSFPDAKIKENYNVIKDTVLKEKPNGIKGDFILSSFITSTMGISYKLKIRA